MSEGKEWTSIGITKEQYAKATKLRAYFEYLTGVRIPLGELFSMTLGLFAGFMAPSKILFDKLEMGEISEELGIDITTVQSGQIAEWLE